MRYVRYIILTSARIQSLSWTRDICYLNTVLERTSCKSASHEIPTGEETSEKRYCHISYSETPSTRRPSDTTCTMISMEIGAIPISNEIHVMQRFSPKLQPCAQHAGYFIVWLLVMFNILSRVGSYIHSH